MSKPLGAVAFLGLVLVSALIGSTPQAVHADPPLAPPRLHRLVVPDVSRGLPRPPFVGPVVAMDIARAGVSSRWTLEERDVTTVGGTLFLEEPSSPDRIAWYPKYGRPGFHGSNTTFTAHVNYVGWDQTPFAFLQTIQSGDPISLTMANGAVYTYTVTSVQSAAPTDLDMAQLLMPTLDPGIDRITLISCTGDFFIQPGVGGEYTQRLVVIAERVLPPDVP